MFFILSKLLRFLISPIIWIVVLFLLAIIFKKKTFSKKFLLISLSLLIFFSNPFIFHETMRLWEPKLVQKKDLKPKYSYGIVLTGMLSYTKEYSRINFNSASDRIFQALELYKEGIIEKIFISGGSGAVLNQENKEAIILKDYLILIGIPNEDIIIEPYSKNTHENALEAAKYLNPKENNETYLLITSAYHLRRAAACFKKQGFSFDIYPTDFYTGKRSFAPDMLIIPKAEAISGWTTLIHELSGYIVYKIAGYS